MTQPRNAQPTGDSHTCGCREYDRLSRRHFLGFGGLVMATAAVPAWLPRVALAQSENSSRDVVVSLFLRGGWDGLTICVPHIEDNLYRLRPGLAVPRPDSGHPQAAIDLDGRFGVSRAFEPLLDCYRDGRLLFVHACGSNDPTRSHFDAMRFMETGSAGAHAPQFTGWLGRHLQTTAPLQPGTPLRGVGIGFGLQQSLAGAPDAVPIRDPGDFGLRGDNDTVFQRRRAIDKMYRGSQALLETSAATTLGTIDLLDEIGFGQYQPAGGAQYPDNDFGLALESTAALIKADVGVEAIAIDYGGWDTHDDQQPLDGTMQILMNGFAQGLSAFHRDLFTDSRENVVVAAMSEFGRNVRENASRGTDHGHGGVMMLLGGAIQGGRVLTDWPGLENELLYEGQDLEVTIDYRDILSEIVTKRLGNPDFRNVFSDPDYAPIEYGVAI